MNKIMFFGRIHRSKFITKIVQLLFLTLFCHTNILSFDCGLSLQESIKFQLDKIPCNTDRSAALVAKLDHVT